MFFTVFSYICTQNRFPMEENKPIDYAEVITCKCFLFKHLHF